MKNTIYASKDLIKKYRWNSIFFQYLKQLFLIIMLPFLVICTVIFVNHTKSADAEIITTYKNSVSKTSNAVSNIVKEVENCYFIFNANPYISIYINSDMTKMNSLPQGFNYQRITELINYSKMSSLYIDSIYVYSAKNNYVLSSKNSNYYEDFYDKSALEPFINRQQSRYITLSKTLQPKSYTIDFGFEFLGNTCETGVITVNLDPDKLREHILTSENDMEAFFLLDENQNVLFSTLSNMEGKPLPEQYRSENSLTRHGEVIKENSQLFYSETICEQLSFVAVGNFMHYKANLKNTALFITLLVILALLLPLAVSFYASIRFYNAIANITTSLQTGQYAAAENDFNEISFINQNIISMIRTQNDIEKELVNKINTLKVAQTVALQTQINPHFLFNTLNLVNVIVMQNLKKENDAEKVISLLAEMLRGTLSTNEFITSVSEELHNTKLYVEIERIKYKNNFDIYWDIDDNVANLKTAKIILQPIVENAFEHGIRKLRGKKGIVRIRAYTTDHHLIFTVNDNGIGMSAERLKEVREQMEKGNLHDSKHIGLYNVNQRIKLIFGMEYGCSITSAEGNTTVAVSLPIIKGEEKN